MQIRQQRSPLRRIKWKLAQVIKIHVCRLYLNFPKRLFRHYTVMEMSPGKPEDGNRVKYDRIYDALKFSGKV